VRKVSPVQGSDADADDDAAEDEFRYISLGAKNTAAMQAGERIIVMTPGGGGWGPVGKASEAERKQDPKESWKGGSVAGRQSEAEASS
jgi:5-oxoprolinase (ATP-hydrolysing)